MGTETSPPAATAAPTRQEQSDVLNRGCGFRIVVPIGERGALDATEVD